MNDIDRKWHKYDSDEFHRGPKEKPHDEQVEEEENKEKDDNSDDEKEPK